MEAHVGAVPGGPGRNRALLGSSPAGLLGQQALATGHRTIPEAFRKDGRYRSLQWLSRHADVDWELLAESYLSTSEKAVVYIARGLAILEPHGGKFELGLRDQILAAVQTIVEIP